MKISVYTSLFKIVSIHDSLSGSSMHFSIYKIISASAVEELHIQFFGFLGENNIIPWN